MRMLSGVRLVELPLAADSCPRVVEAALYPETHISHTSVTHPDRTVSRRSAFGLWTLQVIPDTPAGIA